MSTVCFLLSRCDRGLPYKVRRGGCILFISIDIDWNRIFNRIDRMFRSIGFYECGR